MGTTPPEDVQARVREASRVLVTSHANPDGDAIGSELGLARILRRIGKAATVWNRDPLPSVYGALPSADRIHTGEHAPRGFPDAFDTLVVLECPNLERTGLEEQLSPLPAVNIDHHLGNELYGDVNWVDVSSPAVGEMVLRLAEAMQADIDAETATCLHLALVSDTGGFRFSNATPRAFAAARSLVEKGASPEKISEWLYESRPLGMMRLLGEMLATLELADDGRLATVVLTPDMYERSGAKTSDSEGLVDYPRSIAGVSAVALLRVLDDGGVKVSLRSRGDSVDVERIARKHGGGGHRNAAGFVAEGDLAAVRPRIVAELAAARRGSTRSTP